MICYSANFKKNCSMFSASQLFDWRFHFLTYVKCHTHSPQINLKVAVFFWENIYDLVMPPYSHLFWMEKLYNFFNFMWNWVSSISWHKITMKDSSFERTLQGDMRRVSKSKWREKNFTWKRQNDKNCVSKFRVVVKCVINQHK